MSLTKITGNVLVRPKLSFIKNNIVNARFIVMDENNNIFPVICFDNLAEKINNNISVGNNVEIDGRLFDYSYKDENNTIHYTKILLLRDISIGKNDELNDDTAEQEKAEEYYNYMVKNRYKIVDIDEFEKYSRIGREIKECYP